MLNAFEAGIFKNVIEIEVFFRKLFVRKSLSDAYLNEFLKEKNSKKSEECKNMIC